MVLVGIPVDRLVKGVKWFTVWCPTTPGTLVTLLYAVNLSDHEVVPGWMWACMIGKRVAASLLVIISIYPRAAYVKCPPFQIPRQGVKNVLFLPYE